MRRAGGGGARAVGVDGGGAFGVILFPVGVVGVLVVCVCGLLGLGVALARAEPLCTDTWAGASEGAWAVASNWSAGHVPSSSDVACVGVGRTVTVGEGSFQAGAVEDGGALVISGGSLELASALETSSVGTLTLERATLSGAGTLDVVSSLFWDREATMSGSGKTVLESGASATVLAHEAVCEGVRLVERTFVNEGVVTFSGTYSTGGSLAMSEGARLENVGTFNDNSSASGCAPYRATIVEGSGSKVAPFVLNTGTFDETESSDPEVASTVDVPFESRGTFNGKAGALGFASSVPVTLASGSVLEGPISVREASVTFGSVVAAGAAVTLSSKATLQIASGAIVSVDSLSLEEAAVAGAGTLNILGSLDWEKEGSMSGTGRTVLEGGASGEMLARGPAWCEGVHLTERTLVNDGTLRFDEVKTNTGGSLVMSKGARLTNNGSFYDDSDAWGCSPWRYNIVAGSGRKPEIVNTGVFERTETNGLVTYVAVSFANWGKVAGELDFLYPAGGGSTAWGCSEENPSFPKREVASENGVCTASGDLSESQTDFAVGGRGVGLNVTRTYNSQAAEEGVKSTFGYGWSSPYSQHLTFESTSEPETESELHVVNLVQENGATVQFVEGAGGEWKGPEGSPDVLHGSASLGYTLTLEDQDVYKFSGSSGRLEMITDRNGNTTTFTYNGSGQLEKVTDPASRTLKFAYNAEGLIKTATDPMGHVVEYTYESGNLMSVTEPGETALRWQFKYEGASQLVEMVDGRSGKTTYKYSGAHRVTSKTDPVGRTTSFEYGNTFTKITNEATKAVTVEYLTNSGQLVEAVHGFGTAGATTEAFAYDPAGDTLSATNGDGQTTRYEYDAAGDRVLMEDPEGHKTRWTYDATHDVESETTPDGETTTYKRDSHGNPTTVERPAPGATTQVTTYKYNEHGELESMTDPLKRTWKYEYDAAGDRTAEIDPEGDRRTWGYNEDSEETSTVSPRGHVTGAKESLFTTTTERDPRGLPTKIIAPLKHETTYEYDGDGNLVKKIDPEKNVYAYTYDADNEQTEVEEPNKATTKTEYDGAGQVTKQTDGNGHSTTYKRNVLEQVEEITDPLGRKTFKEYDLAGNLVAVIDAEKRTTSYKYDPDNRLTEISYSDGKTPTVKYEYNGDGDRTKMTDGTGTTSYEYDQLDRLTQTKDGHGDTIGYEYDLANELTKLTYPNGKAVSRAYDNTGRLKSVTDWLEHTTKFTYDADSDLTATAFPTETGDEDTYGYDESDAMSEVKMAKGSETLASLVYTRNKDGEVTKAATTGLPGEEKPAFSYDENSRISKGAGIAYKYDEANNPTTIGSDTYSYNAADELEKATLKKATAITYSYNEVGERTKTEPASGPATSYGYDQAGNLTSVTRPKGSETPAIEDTYAYNGDGLRTSQTISGTTSYLAWETGEELPLLLNDGTNSYIYGAGGLPVEQISGAGTVLYLHHDQQGSTRLLTGSTGAKEASFTYDAYGNLTSSTGTATTPLGYDGQYTNSDTGLIYLRARCYDSATGQFLSVDPVVETTRTPYGYAHSDPLSDGDSAGDDSPTSEEMDFSNWYTRVLGMTQEAMQRKHVGTEDRELFSQITTYYYYAVKAQIAYSDENLEYGRDDQIAYEHEYAHIAGGLLRDFGSLETAEHTTGWSGVIEDLVSLIKKVYGIRIVLHDFP
jgi:RHS repeat-associated protein